MQTVRTKAGERPVGSLERTPCANAGIWLNNIVITTIIAGATTIRVEKNDSEIVATIQLSSEGTTCRPLSVQAENALAEEIRNRLYGKVPIALTGVQGMNWGEFTLQYGGQKYIVGVFYGSYTEVERASLSRTVPLFHGPLELRLQLSQANAA